VTAFLSNYFRKYVGYDFTADLEAELDDVSAGARDWKDVLARFWRDFSAALAETADLRIGEVLEKIDEVLEPHLFPPRADGATRASARPAGTGRLSLKTARSGGAFIGCSNYPECRYTRPLGPRRGRGGRRRSGCWARTRATRSTSRPGASALCPARRGDRGGAEAAAREPAQGLAAEEMDLDRALMLLNLPREIGPHPEDGEMVEAGIGRFGPYVKHGRVYANLPEVDEVFTIGMNRAVEVLAQKAARAGRARRGGGQGAARAWRASRGRRGLGDGRALRSLRQVGQGQRDPAEGDGGGRADDGRRGRASGGQSWPEGGEEGCAEVGAASKKPAAKKPAAKKPAAKKAAPKKPRPGAPEAPRRGD
jgi:DNA topoisomerase I